MKKIPFVDLKSQYLNIKKEIDSTIKDVIINSQFIKGIHVDNFEKKFKNLIGSKYCISVANGTDSLFIIMKMLGIGKGDEVITSSYSWISTSETISLTGAKPIFVDIEPEYYTLNPCLIKKKINKRTKAIIPVHIHGQACDMNKINEISKKYNLFIIEDCAQAHLTEYQNKYVGNFGIASSFSFFPGKNLGAYGDAGGILTKNKELSDKFRMFANHGALVKHKHKIEGINSRLDSLQAAILNIKIKHLLNWTNQRRTIAEYYNSLLINIPEINTPQIRKNTKHAFHLYVIRAEKRDKLMNYLKNKGIEVALHYPKALTNLDCYKNKYDLSEFPIINSYEKKILSLPIYPEMPKKFVEYVCDQIKKFYLN